MVTDCLDRIEVTMENVQSILLSLVPNKAAGLDGFHPRVLKEMSSVLALPLFLIHRQSLETGELPSQWKEAVITPIFKKGERQNPENYRPVSLTSVICKILERIIAKKIIHHVKENGLDCKEQHGFTTGKSVTTNLLETLNVWTEALRHNIPVDVIYLDYRKAFDTVPHLRLIREVERYGIGGQVLQWVKSFLTGRRQRVRANGELSPWSPVMSGVPQGSIMGPILFSLFVNDIPDRIKSFLTMFADDTKIHLPLKTDDAATQLQEDLNKLQEWAKEMQMAFHPNKCKVMHLGKNNPGMNYMMQHEDGSGHMLEETTVERDLGCMSTIA